VSGEHEEKDERKMQIISTEFSYGRIERTIALPERLDTSKVSAEDNNGVLGRSPRPSTKQRCPSESKYDLPLPRQRPKG